MLALVLPFLRANWKLLAAALLILSALTWQRHQGAESVRKDVAKNTARAVIHAGQVSSQLSDNATKAGTEAEASNARIVYRTRTIIQRIPQDVPTAANPHLGAGWVRNYADSLGLPEDPRLAAKPADQPVISAADALAGIDANNAECLKGWDAYNRVVSLYDQARGAVNGFKN